VPVSSSGANPISSIYADIGIDRRTGVSAVTQRGRFGAVSGCLATIFESSIILTTNRPVGSWGEILGDTTVAAALLDRLLHRCVVLTLDGVSYRLRDHHAAAETLRKATTATTR
jgi:IstB-like ATP binding protein